MENVKCYYVAEVVTYRDGSKSIYNIREDSNVLEVCRYFLNIKKFLEGPDDYFGMSEGLVSIEYKLYKKNNDGLTTLIDTCFRDF